MNGMWMVCEWYEYIPPACFFSRFHEIFDNLSKYWLFKEELMNVMTMEVTPQRRNKHEINTQIKEKQSQTATEAQNRCGGFFFK